MRRQQLVAETVAPLGDPPGTRAARAKVLAKKIATPNHYNKMLSDKTSDSQNMQYVAGTDTLIAKSFNNL